MKHIALIAVIAGFGLAGCAGSPMAADYGHSVAQMTENQVYDRTTLTRPSTAAVEGADPDMLNAAVTAMRIPPAERKEVPKPLILNIGGGQ
jgi:hypothetical protein